MNPADEPSNPTPPPSPEPVAATPASHPSGIGADERQWAMLAHLSALLGYLLTGSVGGFLGPLIVWLMKKDTMPFVDQQGKEALNFSISICIAFALLIAFSVMTLGIGLIITLPAFLVVALYALVFTIIASVKANEGVAYRYPIAIRLIK
jgi:uncharacterized Tic20 family protein